MRALTDQLPQPLRALVRTASWHRRLLASGCAAAAVAFGLSTLSPQPPATASVLAAARDIPAGATLTSGDIDVVALPPGAVPAGAFHRGSDIAGRVVAGAVRRGEALTDVRLVGAALFSSVGSGQVAAPVRIADAGVARLLQPGDVIDVFASNDRTTGAAAIVATSARVLAVPSAAGTDGGLDDGALIVVATTPETAALLAKTAVSARLSVAIRGR
jgi:pilus assembly protein CpaB